MKNSTFIALICGLALAFSSAIVANAQTVAPYNPLQATNDLPTNASVRIFTGSPPSPAPFVQLQSPSPSVSFLGLDDNNYTTPPDSQGAVGPSNVVTMLNSQVRIQNRLGTNLSTVTLSNWWSSLGNVTNVYDPRITYDPYGKRWIAAAGAEPGTSAAGLLIAVSQTTDPSGSWYRHRIKVDTNNTLYADYPILGFCGNWIVVTVNLFSGNTFASSRIYAFNRTNVYAGGTTHTVIGLDRSTEGSFVAPAVTYDPGVTNMYLLGFWATGGTNSFLRLYTITGPAASPTFTATSLFPGGPRYAPMPAAGHENFAPQLNNTNRIFNNDARIQNVVYRNGSVWCTHNVFLPAGTNPTRTAVQWWQIRTNGTVLQLGQIDDSSGVNFYAFPSIAVNRFNDVLIGYSRFSANQYASANYSFRSGSDSVTTLRTDTVLKAGEGIYFKTFGQGGNRWGDLSATVIDPLNDADFWTIQEYAATPVGNGSTDGDGRWGTWWGKISVDIPANDNFSAAQAISGFGGSVTNSNSRGSKEAGEPNHAGNAGGSSIWYSWTPTNSGQAVIDTIGSSFDTLLGIYTGSSVSNLTVVASDDDSGGLDGTSRAIFNVTSNTTYKIAVDGFSGFSGTVVLNWCDSLNPTILAQPQGTNVVANENENATFTVGACGFMPLIYQWRQEGTNIPAATNSSFTRVNVQTSHGTNYTVVITNNYGSVTSKVAGLFVHADSAARLGPFIYTNQLLSFATWGLTNRAYRVEISTNLVNWTPLVTNFVTYWTTNSTTNYPQLFYRAITNN